MTGPRFGLMGIDLIIRKSNSISSHYSSVSFFFPMTSRNLDDIAPDLGDGGSPSRYSRRVIVGGLGQEHSIEQTHRIGTTTTDHSRFAGGSNCFSYGMNKGLCMF